MYLERMSGDEFMILIVSAATAAGAWYQWYRIALIRTLVDRNVSRPLLFAAPVFCMMLLYVVLRSWAADDVRSSGIYMTFYMVAGAAWVGLAVSFCRFLDISPRDDAVERQNVAAALATVGALVGITLCFAGGNVGDGPGWWVVGFSAGLSTLGLFGLWALIERLTGISESVTIERAAGAGWRLGGFLVGTGMILGRAVAGDWVSAPATLRDFTTEAWPVLPLAGAAILIERLWPFDGKARAEDAAGGAFLGVAYVAASSFYVFIVRGSA